MVSSSSGSRALARSRRMPLAPIFVRPRCRATLGYTFQDQRHVCAGTPQGPTATRERGVVARIAAPNQMRRDGMRLARACRCPQRITPTGGAFTCQISVVHPRRAAVRQRLGAGDSYRTHTSLAADRNAVAVARAPLAPSRSPSHTLALVPLRWLPSRQLAARRRRMRSAGLQPSLALSRIAARLPQTQSAQAVLLCRT